MAWVERLPSGKWRGGFRDSAGRVYRRTFPHKIAARTWAEDGEQVARYGRDPAAGRALFAEWAARWEAARVVEDTTAFSDAGRLRVLLAEWGDWTLDEIGPLEVQGWAKRLLADRAPGTVRKYVGLLSAILGTAVRARVLTENPCRYVQLPPGATGREVFLTRGQVDALDHEMGGQGVVAYTLAYTGLRWGELAGLHVGRVDFLRRQVDVVETLTETDIKRIKAYPKGRDRRVVPLPSHLVDRLAAHLAERPARPCGLHDGCPGLLFSSSKGPLSRHSWPRDHFRPAVKALGLGPVRVHDLRHTYASWLVQDGVPMREVQYLLGHKSITTSERYSHHAPNVGAAARAALERHDRGAAVEQRSPEGS